MTPRGFGVLVVAVALVGLAALTRPAPAPVDVADAARNAGAV